METSRVLYRKLAMKSTMKFGKFADEKVETLIRLGQIEYLRWVYYNMSNIDFLPEVKDVIGIDKTIAKPGTDIPYWEEYIKERDSLIKKKKYLKAWDELTEEEKLDCFKRSAVKKKNARVRKEKAMRQQAYMEDLRELTPSQLQGINHGHGSGRKRKFPKDF